MEKRMVIDRFVISLFAAIAVIGFLFWFKMNSELGRYTCDVREEGYVVVDGSTLFEIAREHCWGNLGHAVDDLVDKYGSDITPGQLIQLTSKP